MRRRLFLAISLAAGSVVATTPAADAQQAQSTPPISVDIFQPAPAPQAFLHVEQPGVLSPYQLSYGLFDDYAKDPFSMRLCGDATCSGGIGGTLTKVVANSFQANAMLAMGLPHRLQLGLAVPFSYTSGNPLALNPATGAPEQGPARSQAGLGDIQLEGKWLAYSGPQGLDVAIAPIVTIGTGQALVNDKGIGFLPRATAMWTAPNGKLTVGADLGAYLRSTQHYYTNDFGDQLLYGAAAGYEVMPVLSLMAEISGHTNLSGQLDESPAEVDVGARYYLDFTTWLQAGAGTGITVGTGAPQLRVFTAVVYDPGFADRDHDGVPDRVDQCPDDPEDRDGYEDTDGCPDPDNDGDGIPDTRDLCPNEPEDIDNWQDEDGCPDPDNDGDGIPDPQDKCPDVPGPPPTGCPASMTDSDGDGVPDSVDKCPNEPEDKDGYEDADGCPDPDNDKDGIPDTEDQCPNEAEDKDGFRDQDGCPDPDNDLDGIPDTQDKCPNQPETINGYEDDDGCPDTGGHALVTFATDRLNLTARVEFKGATATLLPSSSDLLNQVALTMRAHPEVSLWKVLASAGTGQTVELGQARADAVKTYLVSRGVKAERLHALGVKASVSAVGFAVETAGAIPPDEGQGGTQQGSGAPAEQGNPSPPP